MGSEVGSGVEVEAGRSGAKRACLCSGKLAVLIARVPPSFALEKQTISSTSAFHCRERGESGV